MSKVWSYLHRDFLIGLNVLFKGPVEWLLLVESNISLLVSELVGEHAGAVI